MDTPSKSIAAPPGTPESRARWYAETVNAPESATASVILAMAGQTTYQQMDLPALLDVLRAQTTACSNGDLSLPSKTLAAQLQLLQAAITTAMVAKSQGAVSPAEAERFLKLALRAQAQCVTTVGALAGMRDAKPSPVAEPLPVTYGYNVVPLKRG